MDIAKDIETKNKTKLIITNDWCEKQVFWEKYQLLLVLGTKYVVNSILLKPEWSLDLRTDLLKISIQNVYEKMRQSTPLIVNYPRYIL